MALSNRLRFAQTICRHLPPLMSMPLYVGFLYPYNLATKEAANFTVTSQTGSLYSNNAKDFSAYHFAVTGFSTWRNWAIALAVVKPGDTILEVGANNGTETVGFSDIVGAKGTVYAFEPFPPLVSELKESTRDCTYSSNIRTMNVALSDRTVKCMFVPPTENVSGIGYLVMDDALKLPTENMVEVNCTMLDSLSNDLGAATLICMDTEGAEATILKGGREYIERHKPVIVVEATEETLNRFDCTLESLDQIFKDMGYDVYDIGRFGLGEVDLKSTHVRNWVGLPSGRPEQVRRIERYIKLCGFLPCIPHLNPMTGVVQKHRA